MPKIEREIKKGDQVMLRAVVLNPDREGLIVVRVAGFQLHVQVKDIA